jgi:hypothetical protein
MEGNLKDIRGTRSGVTTRSFSCVDFPRRVGVVPEGILEFPTPQISSATSESGAEGAEGPLFKRVTYRWVVDV